MIPYPTRKQVAFFSPKLNEGRKGGIGLQECQFDKQPHAAPFQVRHIKERGLFCLEEREAVGMLFPGDTTSGNMHRQVLRILYVLDDL